MKNVLRVEWPVVRDWLALIRQVGPALGLLVPVMLLLVGANLSYAQTGGDFDLTWWTVDGGGSGGGIGTSKTVSGGAYELRSTSSQPDAHVSVSGGAYTLKSGFWPSGPPLLSSVYLPVILKNYQNLPDLIGSFTLSPSGPSFNAGAPVLITAVITNVGTATADSFWVDFYINPSTTPAVNLPWNAICGMSPCYGIAWFVSTGLASGQSVTLTSAPGGFSGPHSIWPGSFAGGSTDLYLYVDSWNPTVSTGGVLESEETNNLFHVGGLSVTGLGTGGEPVSPPDLPPRPAP